MEPPIILLMKHLSLEETWKGLKPKNLESQMLGNIKLGVVDDQRP